MRLQCVLVFENCTHDLPQVPFLVSNSVSRYTAWGWDSYMKYMHSNLTRLYLQQIITHLCGVGVERLNMIEVLLHWWLKSMDTKSSPEQEWRELKDSGRESMKTQVVYTFNTWKLVLNNDNYLLTCSEQILYHRCMYTQLLSQATY